MWLIVGLGNPGAEYDYNRHNIGFMVVDALADEYGFGSWKSKFAGLLNDGTIGDQRVLLLKPQTYMNLSGQSVAQVAKFYKITPDKIIVLHDELDLLPGKIRVKLGGGHAGHNGLKSIDACLGVKDYWRVRIGIGHPGRPEMVSHYVLSDFAKGEANMVDDVRRSLSKQFGLMLSGKPDDFMSKVAQDIKG